MNKFNGAWSPLDPLTASIVSSVRMDTSCILADDGAPPPVMFATYELLEQWMRDHGLNAWKIGRIRTTSAVQVQGFYQAASQDLKFGYNQVWASVRYTKYTKALQRVALRYSRGSADLTATGTHADHVINRARLQSHPNAWVAIFPVHRDANCPFGRIEGLLPPIEDSVTRVNLPPLVALKLFCGRLPRTSEELEHAMLDIRGHFPTKLPHVADYCRAMEHEARRYIGL